MEIQFWGAAQCVTGSMHVLTVNGEKLLLECGLFQGHRQEAFERNKTLPFNPKTIDAMVLSHAHIDHSGNIPLLIRNGYEGNIFCTHATQDLASVMLRDSAHIQEKDAEFVNKRHKKKGLPEIEPLYTMHDAEACIHQFVGMGYGRYLQVTPHIQIRFVDAGHILGAAIVELKIDDHGKTCQVVFTGDLGRKNLPIIKDPVQLTEADYLIMESTYGNRTHEPIQNMKDAVEKIIQETISRGGKIIVPSFSVGRTQELVYVLHELFNEDRLPEIPIYVDSPLSVNVTEVFRLHPEIFDRETRDSFLSNHEDPFGFYRLRYIRHVEDSKKLNTATDPCMIISASGMCEAGRILHHLANNIADPKNTVLIIGFMAENTLGRRIMERRPVVKIFGEEVPLNAQVSVLDGFSAHAGQDELISYFKGFQKEKLRQLFLVHGEPDSQNVLADEIRRCGFSDIMIPKRGDKADL